MLKPAECNELEGGGEVSVGPVAAAPAPLFVTEELAVQIQMLSQFPDVLSASVVTNDGQMFEVGGRYGRDIRVVPNTWARNINDWPEEVVNRHGFVVEARFQPQGAFDEEAGIAAHRAGDVCVRPELADLLSQINHPAVALIRLAVAGELEASDISFLKGSHAKAVRVDTGSHFDNHVILQHPFKEYLASDKIGDWLAVLYTATDDLEAKNANLAFDGNVLTAAWEFPLPQDGDFEIPPYFFSIDFANLDVSLRTAWLLELGSRFFDLKIGDAEGFFTGIVQEAIIRGMMGPVSEIRRDPLFCFRKNAEGRFEVYLQIQIPNGGGPGGGPGGGEPIPDGSDDELGDVFAFAA